MSWTRQPAVAGRFYPGGAAELEEVVDRFLEEADLPADLPPPKALIAPHAGYVYSGPIAGSAYAALRNGRAAPIRRVLILGPAHTMPVRGAAASSAAAFATPLGEVAVDGEAVAAVAERPAVQVADDPHSREHGLEVQLPFLQRVCDDFRIVPIVVGEADDAAVAGLIAELDAGPDTLIVISSDLSHYHDYATAQEMDRETAVAIENLDPAALKQGSACGRRPIQGVLRLARQHGWTPHTLDLRNSGDTAGSRDRVVGYGAWVFTAEG